jgi:hypothetical protein
MALRNNTQELLAEIERAAKKKIRYPEAVGSLLEAAQSGGAMDLFQEAAFLAKFVTKSFAIMKRIGVDGDGYDKLSTESEANLAKCATLLRSLNERLPGELSSDYDARFFSLTQDSLGRFLVLLDDLTTLKNWMLDGGTLPGTAAATEEKE